MIDIHCHILPSIDDGPEKLKTSLSMAKIAVKDGIHTVIATPHTEGIRVNAKRVAIAVESLNHELQKKKIPLTILPGHEIPFHLITELADTHTLVGSKYVLVEFPHNFVPPDAADTLFELQSSGLIPIIAHPERNRSVIMNPDILADFIFSGNLVQITAASITGELGPDIERCAYHLLQNNMTHFIATDSHSPSFRKPVLKKAAKTVTRLIGTEKAEMLVIGNPAKIIQSNSQQTFAANAQS